MCVCLISLYFCFLKISKLIWDLRLGKRVFGIQYKYSHNNNNNNKESGGEENKIK